MLSIMGKLVLMTRGSWPARIYENDDKADDKILHLFKESSRLTLKNRSSIQILLAARPSLMGRTFFDLRPCNPTDSPFLRVLNWNVLAQALARTVGNVLGSDVALEWRVRRYYQLLEIVQYQPDVICLQEVDHFRFLNAALESAGYVGVFLPQPFSNCFLMRGNNGPDGLAIFYSEEKFSSATWFAKRLSAWGTQTDEIALGVILKFRSNNMEVFIAVTQLMSCSWKVMATIREQEGMDFLTWAHQKACNRPVVLCGNYNGSPNEPFYRRMMRHPMNLQSAYRIKSVEPEFTKWKKNGDVEEKKCVDYIFHSRLFLPVKVLAMPEPERIAPRRLPNAEYPSDHLAMVADFELNKRYRLTGQLLKETAL